eukprot:TRINITY_DN20890_c0_g1_i1.p1 TRINITY_DN20890_c0_g1~~TRINITY_DN20890_c0_g1_i1.p1  ORF type:complete len:202 (-),score=63.59 TRINITY_DN20890_c0_g1_i1:110-715(-)
MGSAACFRTWLGLVIRKKALTAAWIAQRQALAKIESAKNMEMKTILNQERNKSATAMAAIQNSHRKGNAMRALDKVLQRWILRPQHGALRKWQLGFWLSKENQDSLQEAVQAATFETELRRKQGESQMERQFDLIKREAGLKIMKHVLKKLELAVVARCVVSMRRNLSVHQEGASVAIMEAKLSQQLCTCLLYTSPSPRDS